VRRNALKVLTSSQISDVSVSVHYGIGIGRDETRFTGTIHKVILDVKDVK